jgi:hypothetical protein
MAARLREAPFTVQKVVENCSKARNFLHSFALWFLPTSMKSMACARLA